jgi:hypothetical protein
MDQYKDVFREQIRSAEREKSKRVCSQYPSYLLTDNANLEYFYAEQVATIRKGPQGK